MPALKCESTRLTPKPRGREADYAYAKSRARKHHHLERGYEVATHFTDEIMRGWKRHSDRSISTEFRAQVDRWKDETGNLSSVAKAISHPSYLRVIGLARASSDNTIERLILQELESEPDYWFAALSAITGEDPVKPAYDFDEAVTAWLAWGREKGII